MVNKGVRRQFERSLSAGSTIAILGHSEPVPALKISSDTFRRDGARLGGETGISHVKRGSSAAASGDGSFPA
jgi:hypothetical protein